MLLKKNIPTTWMYHLNKPENRKILEDIKDSGDRSPEQLVYLYKFVRDTLKPTECWNVSGVNKLLNEMTAEVKATLTNAKSGKSSAPTRARKLLGTIAYCGVEEATDERKKRSHWLQPVLTDEELEQMLLGA